MQLEYNIAIPRIFYKLKTTRNSNKSFPHFVVVVMLFSEPLARQFFLVTVHFPLPFCSLYWGCRESDYNASDKIFPMPENCFPPKWHYRWKLKCFSVCFVNFGPMKKPAISYLASFFSIHRLLFVCGKQSGDRQLFK